VPAVGGGLVLMRSRVIIDNDKCILFYTGGFLFFGGGYGKRLW